MHTGTWVTVESGSKNINFPYTCYPAQAAVHSSTQPGITVETFQVCQIRSSSRKWRTQAILYDFMWILTLVSRVRNSLVRPSISFICVPYPVFTDSYARAFLSWLYGIILRCMSLWQTELLQYFHKADIQHKALVVLDYPAYGSSFWSFWQFS